MSWTRRTGEMGARLANIARRFVAIDSANPLRWFVRGFQVGNDEETDAVDVFGGVGYAARPPAKAETEAIAVAINGRDHHVVVAVRDADTLQAVIDDIGLSADETAIFTSKAVVKLTADGEVLIGRVGGQFKPVALADHSHPVPVITGQASYAPGPPAGPNTGPSDKNSSNTKVT